MESGSGKGRHRSSGEGEVMTKTMMVLAAAATLAVSAVATPQKAEAGGGRIAAGLIGGLAVGALIGGAIASSSPAYAGPYGYYGAPAAYPACYWQRQQFWNGFAWQVRRVQVCG